MFNFYLHLLTQVFSWLLFCCVTLFVTITIALDILFESHYKQFKVIFIQKLVITFALVALVLTGCEDKLGGGGSRFDGTNGHVGDTRITRAVRPVVLGEPLNNPFSVENMQAALDTLRAHDDQLDGCMKSKSVLNAIEISTTDLYVRFLPQDSAQYRRLMCDSTLTLFDFPLDYEIAQYGDYYKDPTVSGDYTWLYTCVPKDYEHPAGIAYEVLDELFLYENSAYYSEEIIEPNGPSNVKSSYGADMNDALKTIKAIAFFNTGNKYGEPLSTKTHSLQKVRKSVQKKFLWKTWVEYEYYPSGTISVESYHAMDEKGATSLNSSLKEVPLKGVKLLLWNWFKFNPTYTDKDGKYESDMYFDGAPGYYLYFSGQNGTNSWDLDRVMLWGACLWVQKLNLGEHSNDGYTTTIASSSDAWAACVTNNAVYEYMTICDKEGLSRPPAHLQVALRENRNPGSSSAPLFQNHTNTYTTAVLGGFFTNIFLSGVGGAVATGAYAAFLTALPDVLLAGGNIDYYINNKGYTRYKSLYMYYSTVWHELTHASNLQRVKSEKGKSAASTYWSGLVGTEVGHAIATGGDSSYGKKGDNNWQQVALCEGWANYIGTWTMPRKYLSLNNKKTGFPRDYQDMFEQLLLNGCSIHNMEKCLTIKTFSEFKQLLSAEYKSNVVLQDSINAIVDRYYNN